MLSDKQKLEKYDKMEETRRKYWRSKLIRQELLERKCEEKGIVVTKNEVEIEYNKKYGKK